MVKELRNFNDKGLRAELETLCPTIDDLRTVLGTLRHAFNRNSVRELDPLAQLHPKITLDLDLVFEKVEIALEKGRPGEKPYLLRLQGVLTHLELMGAHLHDLAEHLRRKIRIGAIFLDKDVIFLNNLFSRQTGLLRTLVDVMKRDNQLLRTYLRDESSRLIEDCFSVREHHELQMMDSHVHPEGWGLFIGMLEQMQAISKHLLETLKFLEK